MKTRALIDGASFGPDTLRVIGRAFDETWAAIAGNFGDPEAIRGARLALAIALIEVATDSSRDAAELKKAAIQLLARRYQHGSIGGLPYLN